MTDLKIRDLEEPVERFLRARAQEEGVSLEDAARAVLRGVVKAAPPQLDAGMSAAPEGAERPWRLKASRDEILALGKSPDKPIDWKALSDEMWDESLT